MKSVEDSAAPRKGGAFDTGIREAWTDKPQLGKLPSSAADCVIHTVQRHESSSRHAVCTNVHTPQLATVASSSTPLASEPSAKKLHQMSVHLTSDEHEAAMERAKAFPSFNAYMRHAIAVERASRKPSGLRLSNEEIGRAVRVMIEEGRKP